MEHTFTPTLDPPSEWAALIGNLPECVDLEPIRDREKLAGNCKNTKLAYLKTDKLKDGMELDCPTTEAILQIGLERGWSNVANLRFNRASLVGLVELARTAIHCGKPAISAIDEALGKIPEAPGDFRKLVAMFEGIFDKGRPSSFLFSSPPHEYWLVRGTSCLESQEFSFFTQRFQRRLGECGFGKNYSAALGRGLLEMVENVVRHSGAPGLPSAHGVVGYHVVPNSMNYVVADLGRGVLQSLRDNPKWQRVASECEALVLAAKEGATRSPGQSEGDGFRVAFQGFVDRGGILSMRSGDGVVQIQGTMDAREATVCNAPPLPGLRVVGMCALGAETAELPFRY